MYATLARPSVRTAPPSLPPVPPRGHVTAGATDPDDPDWDAFLEAQYLREEDGETANGCDWPDGPLSPTGCLW